MDQHKEIVESLTTNTRNRNHDILGTYRKLENGFNVVTHTAERLFSLPIFFPIESSHLDLSFPELVAGHCLFETNGDISSSYSGAKNTNTNVAVSSMAVLAKRENERLMGGMKFQRAPIRVQQLQQRTKRTITKKEDFTISYFTISPKVRPTYQTIKPLWPGQRIEISPFPSPI